MVWQFSEMAKTFRTYLPEQSLLLPASLREWLPDDHLSYFVSDVVGQLNLSAIESVYEEEDRGQPPYHPRMMTICWSPEQKGKYPLENPVDEFMYMTILRGSAH
jgi:hypothetical protein